MTTIRLTMAQALVRYLCAQYIVDGDREHRLCPGVFAIFGHGNVAGLGEALAESESGLPTYRAHNEQAMAFSAIAFAKQARRRRFMACTTSIGPGATNMVTACALAHVNRLPVLLLPGDIFASRRPDPVLQQIERFDDSTASANDCFRPVSRYFDRIMRPEQILTSLPQALAVLLDPAQCGPVTLALPQDVQAEAYDYPISFFERGTHRIRRQTPDGHEIGHALELIHRATRPIIIAGGGVKYSYAEKVLDAFASSTGIPVCETQAGKGCLPHRHPQNVGAVGVTGASSANELAAVADVVIAMGTRLQDFTTGSRALFRDPHVEFVSVNAAVLDATKHDAHQVVGDVRSAIDRLSAGLTDWSVPDDWRATVAGTRTQWHQAVDRVVAPPTTKDSALPTDAQVIGAVNRSTNPGDVVVAAAGGVPGELHKVWRCDAENEYHVEYGYSCMGYEIAGGLGVKMANQSGDVFVLVGDGSYMMLNSEIATSVLLNQKLIIVLLDNRGFGCINRLQKATGGREFNNLLKDCIGYGDDTPSIDFVKHAEAMGATAQKVESIAELGSAIAEARTLRRTHVIVIDTDPDSSTVEGGAWWDVSVPQESRSTTVNSAYAGYVDQKRHQRP